MATGKERVSGLSRGWGLARTLTGTPTGTRVLLFQSRAQDAEPIPTLARQNAYTRLPSFHSSFHMPLGTSLSPHGANPKLRRVKTLKGLHSSYKVPSSSRKPTQILHLKAAPLAGPAVPSCVSASVMPQTCLLSL